MSKSQHSDTVADAVGTLLPGQLLQHAREQQGISLDQVSDRIKVSVAQLTAIEQGDMDRLPGLAFARGYIRTYGKFLGLDADALVNDFNAHYSGSSQRPVKTINRVKPQAHLGDPMIRVSIILFVLILLGSSVWWWQTQMRETPSLVDVLSEVSSALVKPDHIDAPEKSTAGSEDQVVVDEPLVRLQEAEPEYLTDTEIATLTPAAESDEETATTSDLTEEVTTEPLSPAIDNGDLEAVETSVLVIRVSGECWVSIKDTSGKVLFASLMQDGDTLERNLDVLPVDLLIGQVSAVVESQFRGQSLDLASSSRKGVARLTLK